MQIYNTVATCCGVRAVGVLIIATGSAYRVGNVIPAVGQGSLANSEGDMLVVNRVNLQCQGSGTVATGLVEVVSYQGVAASHIESSVKTIGIVSCASTYSIRQSGSIAVVDGQMQGNGTVAALAGAEMLYIVAAGGISLIIPLISIAGNL